MRKINKGILHAELFDSLAEFNNYIESRPENDAFMESDHLQSKAVGQLDFAGCDNFDEAKSLMRDGYKEGLKNLMKGEGGINYRSHKSHTIRRNDFVGQRPNIPNTIMGKPKTMVRRVKADTAVKVISIFYDCGASAATERETLAIAGKNAMALVSYLEDHGFRVTLMCMTANDTVKKHRAVMAVKVKDSKQQLNPLLISYPLTHPAFFRFHKMKWMEVSDATNCKEFTEGYGYTLRRTIKGTTMQDYLRQNGVMDKQSYYIDCESCAECNSIDEVLKLIKFNERV